jgi:hypothetical protein
MHFLIGLGLAVTLLYFWLIGDWFARVLVFLLLGAIGGLFGAMALKNAPAGALIFTTCWIIAGWFIASIPIYVQRHRAP